MFAFSRYRPAENSELTCEILLLFSDAKSYVKAAIEKQKAVEEYPAIMSFVLFTF